MKTDLEYLTEARAMVAHGWCQYQASYGERVCATGALMRAVKPQINSADRNATYVRLMGALASALGDSRTDGPTDGCGIIAFNDRPDTTQADVLALYDRAIAKLTRQLPCGCATDGTMCEEHAPSICCQSLDEDMRKEFECRCKADACP